MLWLIYAALVLLISIAVGFHLDRFREAYTEMTGMMAGMTMGMLNGFVLGYAAGAYFASMFWANLVGILLGLALGAYYGRMGGLMGIMDGGMGGVMGGSMGAMLGLMIIYPTYGLLWTLVLLTVIYLAGMAGLIVLIERSAPGHRALHLLAPFFTRAVADEIAEQRTLSNDPTYFDDYYTFLNIKRDATNQQVTDAYLEILSIADEAIVARAERALTTLNDPVRRRAYDTMLDRFIVTGNCCPPSPSMARSQAAQPRRATSPKASPNAQSIPERRPARTGASAERVAQASRKQPTPSAPRSQTRSRSRAPKRRVSPVTWIGGGVAFYLAASLFLYWLVNIAPGGTDANAYTDSGVPLSAEQIKSLEARAITLPVAADGTQSLDMAIAGGQMSYTPEVIRVKKGQPVRLNITADGDGPACNLFVGIQRLGVSTITKPGQPTPMTFTPDRAGIYQINCSMHMMTPGYLIVTQ